MSGLDGVKKVWSKEGFVNNTLSEVHISRNGEVIAQVPFEHLQQYVDDGTILSEDYAWHEGLEDWITVTALLNSLLEPVSEASPLKEEKTARKNDGRKSKKFISGNPPTPERDWRQDPATDKQLSFIRAHDVMPQDGMTKGEASDLITNLKNDPEAQDRLVKRDLEKLAEYGRKIAEKPAHHLRMTVEKLITELNEIEEKKKRAKIASNSQRAIDRKYNKLLEREKAATDPEVGRKLRFEMDALLDEELGVTDAPDMGEDEESLSEDAKGLKEEINQRKRVRTKFWKETFREKNWVDSTNDDDDDDELTMYLNTISNYHEKYGQFFKMPTHKQINDVLEWNDQHSADWDLQAPESFYGGLLKLYPEVRRTSSGGKTNARGGRAGKNGCLIVLILPLMAIAIYHLL